MSLALQVKISSNPNTTVSDIVTAITTIRSLNNNISLTFKNYKGFIVIAGTNGTQQGPFAVDFVMTTDLAQQGLTNLNAKLATQDTLDVQITDIIETRQKYNILIYSKPGSGAPSGFHYENQLFGSLFTVVVPSPAAGATFGPFDISAAFPVGVKAINTELIIDIQSVASFDLMTSVSIYTNLTQIFNTGSQVICLITNTANYASFRTHLIIDDEDFNVFFGQAVTLLAGAFTSITYSLNLAGQFFNQL